MHRTTRLKITELNPHLICVLCGGYFIDAATIKECLHSFCRSCIVRYLETTKYCPICDALVHKTKPLINIRPDQTLQDLVYKLVPGLFKTEMQRRRDFYEKYPNAAARLANSEDRGEASVDRRVIYAEDDKISLSLEYSYFGQQLSEQVNSTDPDGANGELSEQPKDKRFLLCPAAFTVGHLKKFIRMKFDLSPKFQIVIFHTDEALSDSYTLMDIAYIYSWRRRGPLRLFYTVYENMAKKKSTKRQKVSHESHNTENQDLNSDNLPKENEIKKESSDIPINIMEIPKPLNSNSAHETTPCDKPKENGNNLENKNATDELRVKNDWSDSENKVQDLSLKPKQNGGMKPSRSSTTLDGIVEKLRNGNVIRESAEKKPSVDDIAK